VTTYRPDIDGLRAVAILSVVAYHCSETLMPGGFIGVDVFFVISGYLITKIIANDIARGRFSIAGFYVRRTKRILPALFVVLITTLLLGLFLLTPSELSGLGRTTAATSAFVSNITFWRDTGYFDIAAERKPLLHTWSLAVEEQFYLLWPLVLFLVSKTRANIRHLLGAGILLSFGVSCYAVLREPGAAFFLLPTRAWELLVGAALTLGVVPQPRSRALRHGLAVAGLAMIVVGLRWLDRTSPFPGWNALLPCVGTALLIHAGEQGNNVVSDRLLSRAPMVFVGLISYSLYLWHWPLLSLGRITQHGTLTLGQALGLVAVAVVLSVLTWRFVETPLRAKHGTPAAAPVLIRYAVASVAAFALGASLHLSRGLVQFASPEILRTELARYDGNPLSGRCLRWQSETGPLAGAECMSGQERFSKRLVLWGDSHADAAAPGVIKFAADHGYATHQLTMAGCPPLMGAEVKGPGADYAACTAFNRRVLNYVTEDRSIEVVMLISRWTLYTENARFGTDDQGPITYLVDPADRSLSTDASRRVFSRHLDATIAGLREAGKTVIVLGTIPPLGINVPACIARNYMPFSDVRQCSVDADLVLPHLRYVDSEIERLGMNRPGVCTYLPKKALCPDGTCLDTVGGDILYANDDHLSSRGAVFLSQHFEFGRCLATPPRASARRAEVPVH